MSNSQRGSKKNTLITPGDERPCIFHYMYIYFSNTQGCIFIYKLPLDHLITSLNVHLYNFTLAI